MVYSFRKRYSFLHRQMTKNICIIMNTNYGVEPSQIGNQSQSPRFKYFNHCAELSKIINTKIHGQEIPNLVIALGMSQYFLLTNKREPMFACNCTDCHRTLTIAMQYQTPTQTGANHFKLPGINLIPDVSINKNQTALQKESIHGLCEMDSKQNGNMISDE